MSSRHVTVHIRSSQTGLWRVEPGTADGAVHREFGSETEAVAAVRETFGGHDGELVLHDRYERTHCIDLALMNNQGPR